MPIKWTPERDQTLLLKILETSQIQADVKAISKMWPSTEEAPTPRAIQERLHKIRAMAGGKGTGTFKMVGTVGGARSGSAKSSPAKSTPAKTTTAAFKTPTKAAAKRKHAVKEEYYPFHCRIYSSPLTLGNSIDSNASELNSDIEDVKDTPSKKAKKSADSVPDWATTGIKKEGGAGGMDGSFEASFTMPGEI
ncbi:MAG: hypothetical protein Q9182_001016 [Xanthomendoza sp. 2 TL-2023]